MRILGRIHSDEREDAYLGRCDPHEFTHSVVMERPIEPIRVADQQVRAEHQIESVVAERQFGERACDVALGWKRWWSENRRPASLREKA